MRMKKDEDSVLNKLMRLAKPKKKHYYRLFMIENGVEKLMEEKEIDGDEDMTTKICFEDYSGKNE